MIGQESVPMQKRTPSLPEGIPLDAQIVGNFRKETMLRDRYHQEKKLNEAKLQYMEQEMIALKKQMKAMIDKCKTQIHSMVEENALLKKANDNLIHQQQKLEQAQEHSLQKQKAKFEQAIHEYQQALILAQQQSPTSNNKSFKILTVPEALEEANMIRALSPTKQQKLHEYIQDLLSSSENKGTTQRKKLTLRELEVVTPDTSSNDEGVGSSDLIEDRSISFSDSDLYPNSKYLSSTPPLSGDPQASLLPDYTSVRSMSGGIALSSSSSTSPPLTTSTVNHMYLSSGTSSPQEKSTTRHPSKATDPFVLAVPSTDYNSGNNTISPFLVPEAIFNTLQNTTAGTVTTASEAEGEMTSNKTPTHNIDVIATSSNAESSPVNRAIDFTTTMTLEEKKDRKYLKSRIPQPTTKKSGVHQEQQSNRMGHASNLEENTEDSSSSLDAKVKSMVQRIEAKGGKSPQSTSKLTRSSLKERNVLQSRNNKLDPSLSPQKGMISKKSQQQQQVEESSRSEITEEPVIKRDKPVEMFTQPDVAVFAATLPASPSLLEIPKETLERAVDTADFLSEEAAMTAATFKDSPAFQEQQQQITYYANELTMMQERYSQVIILLNKSLSQQKQYNTTLSNQNQQFLQTIEEKHQHLQDYEEKLQYYQVELTQSTQRIQQLEDITQQIYQEKKQLQGIQARYEKEQKKWKEQQQKSVEKVERLEETVQEKETALQTMQDHYEGMMQQLQEELTLMQEKYSTMMVQSIQSSEHYKEIIQGVIQDYQETEDKNRVEGNDRSRPTEEIVQKVTVETSSTIPQEIMILPLKVEEDVDGSSSSTVAEDPHSIGSTLTLLKEYRDDEVNTEITQTMLFSMQEKEALEQEIGSLRQKLVSFKNKFKQHTQKLQQKMTVLEKESSVLRHEKAMLETSHERYERVLMGKEEGNLQQEETENEEEKVQEKEGERKVKRVLFSTSSDSLEPLSGASSSIPLRRQQDLPLATSCEPTLHPNHDELLIPPPEQQQQLQQLQEEVQRLQQKLRHRSSKAIEKMKSLFAEITSKQQTIVLQSSQMEQLQSMINIIKLENVNLKHEIHALTQEIGQVTHQSQQQIESLSIQQEKKTMEIVKLKGILEKERHQMKMIQSSMELLGSHYREKLVWFGSQSQQGSVANSAANSRAPSPPPMLLLPPSSSHSKDDSNQLLEKEVRDVPQVQNEEAGKVKSADPATELKVYPIQEVSFEGTEKPDEDEEELVKSNPLDTLLEPAANGAEEKEELNTETVSIDQDDTPLDQQLAVIQLNHQALQAFNQDFCQDFQETRHRLQKHLLNLEQENHQIIDYIQKRATEHHRQQQRATNPTTEEEEDAKEKEKEQYEVEGNYDNCLKDYNNQINSISLTLFERIKQLYKENERKADEVEEWKEKYERSQGEMKRMQERMKELEAMVANMQFSKRETTGNDIDRTDEHHSL